MNINRIASAAFFIAALIMPLTSHANLVFNVSLNTSPLIGNPNGPFTIDFQLNDGSGSNDANNSATLSNFSLGGGSLSGSAATSGGASGALSSIATLIDSSFLNSFDQKFNPGSKLSFDVSLTTHVDGGTTPDGFFFSLLDGAGNQIPTTGLLSSFLEVDLTSANPAIQVFGGVGTYAGIGSPLVTPVPIPATLPLFLSGMLLLARRSVAMGRHRHCVPFEN